MKTNILLTLYCLSFSFLSAQTTSIPDSEFEQELINQGIDSDGELNGQVSTSDIENITSLTIEGDYPYIQELTGIEGFSNLQHLVINWTEITELDISQNTQLITLDCGSNLLTSIDVSSNPLLEELYCGNLEV